MANGQNAQAFVALNAFIDRRPPDRLAPEAQLLLGQAFEASGRNDEAMAAFAAVAEKYPQSPRAPEAMFRQAQGVLRSRQSQREQAARTLLTQVAEGYPSSEWAGRALLQRAQIEERVRERVADATVGGQVPIVLLTYRILTERYPSRSENALWRMSEIYGDMDRYQLQAQALTELTTRFPATKLDAYWKLGEVSERRLKDKARAIEAYSRVPSSSSKYRDAQKKVEELNRR